MADLVSANGRLATFSGLTDAARWIWAKTGDDDSSHGLLPHLLDVAASARVLVDREPDSSIRIVAQGLALPPDLTLADQRNWLAYLVGLHDIGKASPGFQAKSRSGAVRDQSHGLHFDGAALERDRHDLASADFLRRRWPELGYPRIWSNCVARAISGHHGEIPTSLHVHKGAPVGEHPGWREARIEVLSAYTQALNPTGIPAASEPSMSALSWLAGLTSVSDWIGSNTDFFPFGERDARVLRHFELSLGLAQDALNSIGWRGGQLSGRDLPANDILARLAGASATARPLQTSVDRLLSSGAGPALIIIEAPMGEGKTEAAFLAHLRLQARNGHRGMYVALPTQATGNAMFRRTVEFLEVFGSTSTCDIQLVHAGAAMNDDYTALKGIRGINQSTSASVAASEWFTKRKRPLLSPYGAGTVDQAILAAMHVPHHFVRLFGLGNKTVVLDEMHAYDAYTGGLIEGLLAFLRGMGCSVVLMSATLPAERRRSLLSAWGATSEVTECDYPRATVVDDAGPRALTFSARAQLPIALLGCAESLDAIAELAAVRVDAGGCGAVIVNTVARAQRLYKLLRQRLPADTRVILFHARFPGDDRKAREQEVLAALGKQARLGAGRPARCLLIATQVAEQSLDIDMDWMLTDLAPVDLVLQRAGRLHRHERADRPTAHATPTLIVAGLSSLQPPDLKGTAWQFVYDEYILLRSWALLRRLESIRMPLDIDVLVQQVYGAEPLTGLPPGMVARLALARTQSDDRSAEQSARAARTVVDASRSLDAAYPVRDLDAFGDEEALSAMTRDGEDSVAAVPVFETDRGWSLSPGGPAFEPDADPSWNDAQQIYMRQVRLSNKAIVMSLIKEPMPRGWLKSPLLRNLRPLVLTADRWIRGSTRVLLDAELGIVIERDSSSRPRSGNVEDVL
jgi:CRISPR-associated endonuclease/helicase Cas3